MRRRLSDIFVPEVKDAADEAIEALSNPEEMERLKICSDDLLRLAKEIKFKLAESFCPKYGIEIQRINNTYLRDYEKLIIVSNFISALELDAADLNGAALDQEVDLSSLTKPLLSLLLLDEKMFNKLEEHRFPEEPEPNPKNPNANRAGLGAGRGDGCQLL